MSSDKSIVHEISEPYPTVAQYDEHGARYGICKAQLALVGDLDEHGCHDPYGVLIEYYDKKTKQQGSVKLMHHHVQPDLWPALNNAINAILAAALEKVRA